MRRIHRMPFGAQPHPSGGTRFRLWAPGRAQVTLERVRADAAAAVESWPMERRPGGWHERVLASARAGMLYRYRMPDGLAVPDPASRSNPRGVHGASEVIAPAAYAWGDAGWQGRPWHTAVLYELHVGTFTPEGRLDAAAARLPRLRELGISAVELMPVAAFAGARGWGYDGVLLFAPHSAYGSPDDLKRFVDTAHRLDMMVVLDVVYNHFGPDGNYLHAWCPEFFDPHRATPWGSAIRLEGADSGPVRRFLVDNALFWIEEYHIDGLRLDATHALHDTSVPHIVAAIAQALRDGPGRERAVHLIVENDANTARWLGRDAGGRPLLASAQLNDDLHHAAHVLATREVDGCYGDYADDPAALLARALAEGFVYQGQPSHWRGGVPRGEPSAELPSQAFVAFLQNHDQVGNRAFGERLDALADPRRVDALLACLLLAPQVPMLFMGEEFAAQTPFLYFCDHAGALADDVREGRRQGFAARAAFADTTARTRIPDPNRLETFEASKLRWAEADAPRGRARLALVQRLLALRRAQLEPLLPLQRHGGSARSDHDGFVVEWTFGDVTWSLQANFGAAAVDLVLRPAEEEVFRSDAGPRLQRDAVRVAVRREPPHSVDRP